MNKHEGDDEGEEEDETTPTPSPISNAEGNECYAHCSCQHSCGGKPPHPQILLVLLHYNGIPAVMISARSAPLVSLRPIS